MLWYVHLKTGNHLRSHLKAIMALDHRRLIRSGKKKSGRIFWVRQVYSWFTLQNLANKSACKPTFYTTYTSHLRWNSTWGTVFTIQTSKRMQYFTILRYKFHSFNIQDNRSMRGLFAKPFKKFPKLHIRPAGSNFCSARCGRVFEWTLIELRLNIIKNLLCIFFLLNGFIYV